MAGKSETSQGPTEEIRTRDAATAQHANTKVTQEQAMPPPREFLGPWDVVTSRERPKNRDRASVIPKKANDELDGPDGTAEESDWAQEKTWPQGPTAKASELPKPVRPSNREDRQQQPAGDWYYNRQMDPRTERDYASDTMERPVHLTASQEEAKAWRAAVKQRQEDKDRESEREAIK
jgi:hypothetical protein